MAAHGTVLLQRVCLRPECLATFFLCQHCNRGHRYCSRQCSAHARREQRRRANQRHQRSPEGSLDHRDRQRAYRHRCRQQQRVSVTDHSSASVTSPALLACGDRRQVSADPPRSGQQAPLWHCRICGRTGRFINPFPPTPLRRYKR